MNDEIGQGNPQKSKVHTLKQCMHCKADIPAEAGTCRYCNLSQKKWHRLRHAPFAVSLVLMFAVIGQVSIAFFQMNKAIEIKKEVEKIRDDLREVVKYVVENDLIFASSTLLSIEGDTKYKERVDSNMSKLFDFVEPDEEKRHKWHESIGNLIEGKRQNEE